MISKKPLKIRKMIVSEFSYETNRINPKQETILKEKFHERFHFYSYKSYTLKTN